MTADEMQHCLQFASRHDRTELHGAGISQVDKAAFLQILVRYAGHFSISSSCFVKVLQMTTPSLADLTMPPKATGFSAYAPHKDLTSSSSLVQSEALYRWLKKAVSMSKTNIRQPFSRSTRSHSRVSRTTTTSTLTRSREAMTVSTTYCAYLRAEEFLLGNVLNELRLTCHCGDTVRTSTIFLEAQK